MDDKCNEATAEGVDELGGTVGPVSDDACVEVVEPCIEIEKTVDFDGDGVFSDFETGIYGSTATWKIVVTNCGDGPLTNVMVSDTNGGTWGPFDLAAGESWETTYDETGIMDDKCNTATAQGVDELGGTVGPVNDDACVEAVIPQGCTPGYWKNNAAKWGAVSWGPTGYSPDDLFSDVFGVVITVRSGGKSTIEDPTLLEALQANGGGVNALARHAVAALLNAAHPNISYAMSHTAVITAVHDALSSGDPGAIETVKGQLGEYNEAGCSLDMHGNPIDPEEEPDGVLVDPRFATIGVILPVLGGAYWRRRKASA